MRDHDFAVKFGARVRTARIGEGLTQEELGELTGTDAGRISRMESGQRVPVASKIPVLCKALRCSPSWLLGLE